MSQALLYDVHFWIGKHSTQDEYGTAAYKTVELDTLVSYGLSTSLLVDSYALGYSMPWVTVMPWVGLRF